MFNKKILNTLVWVLETFKSTSDGNPMSSLRYRDFKHLLDHIGRIKKYQGLNHSVKVLKSIRLHVTRYISGNPLLVSDMRLGLTKEGLPKALGPLIPYIRGLQPTDLRLILTGLTIGRSELGDGTLDVKSIVSPRKGNLSQALLLETDIVNFLPSIR